MQFKNKFNFIGLLIFFKIEINLKNILNIFIVFSILKLIAKRNFSYNILIPNI